MQNSAITDDNNQAEATAWKKPASRVRAFSGLTDIIQFLVLLAFLGWLFSHSIENLGYNWQWYRIPAFIVSSLETGLSPGPLLLGLGVTLKISAISMIFMLIIGLVTAAFRLSGVPGGEAERQALPRGKQEHAVADSSCSSSIS